MKMDTPEEIKDWFKERDEMRAKLFPTGIFPISEIMGGDSNESERLDTIENKLDEVIDYLNSKG